LRDIRLYSVISNSGRGAGSGRVRLDEATGSGRVRLDEAAGSGRDATRRLRRRTSERDDSGGDGLRGAATRRGRLGVVTEGAAGA